MSEDREFRIGIDVGGTNTDAVVIDSDGAVVSAGQGGHHPRAIDGIRESLSKVLQGIDKTRAAKAMLGTTHPTNAIIQRRGPRHGGRAGAWRRRPRWACGPARPGPTTSATW